MTIIYILSIYSFNVYYQAVALASAAVSAEETNVAKLMIIIAKGEAKLRELMRPDHPAIDLLHSTANIIKREEWCGDYIGAAGKKKLICDLEVRG